MLKINPERLGFDFDGVIGDIGEAFLRIACDQYDYCSFKLSDITNFHVEQCTAIPEEVVAKIFTAILEDSLATGLLPMDGAVEVLEYLSKNNSINIITARTLDQPVQNWLEKFLSKEACSKINLIAMHDHDQKVRFLEAEKIDYFIDDRGRTCEQVKSAGRTPILYRQPWNRSYNDFATVNNWQEIMNLINNSHAMSTL